MAAIRIVAVIAVLVVIPAVAQTDASTFSLSITLSPSSVKSGSDVRVDIAKKNISKHDINGSFMVGTAERSYEVVVKAEDGSLAAPTPYGQKIRDPKMDRYTNGTGSMIIGSLPPGQELKQMLFLNLIYDISRPGKYTIQVTQTDRDKSLVVKSNIVTLTVTP